ncbi:phage major capsid protein, HK97 family [Clostridium perfringens]|uniref:Phage major capsid protein, HK97 family n=1 Tax=Clostridium perfringens TaxID=1502 RepID=A0A2X2Y4Q5_CLOPF|nr:phage major capsid protein [Clostridium perfringens]MDM1010771.1 phage major capsid protein [Clostridium perfringens]SQB57823.1 phage major capsid protein, HK97 family [Clostridium perfringens]
MGIKELRERYEALKSELREFIEAGDLEKSKAKEKEVKEARELLRIAEDQEKEDRERILNQKRVKEDRKITREEELRAIAAIALKRGSELTDEERGTIVSSGNSAIIPKQFVDDLIEIKKGYGSLKEYCDVIPVTKNEGTVPVIDYDQNELADVVEGQDIVEGNLVTTDVSFKCTKVGLFQKVSSETIDDASIEVDTLIRNNFSEIATTKENKKIIALINKNATVVEEVTDYDAIENAIDSTVPSAKTGVVTLCNSAGYCLLNNKKDNQGRPLNLITVGANGVEYFHNKPIAQFDDSLVAPTKEKKAVFFVLNFKEAVKFIDRKQITVATGKEIKDDTDMWSILERIDVVSGSKRTIKKIEL